MNLVEGVKRSELLSHYDFRNSIAKEWIKSERKEMKKHQSLLLLILENANIYQVYQMYHVLQYIFHLNLKPRKRKNHSNH